MGEAEARKKGMQRQKVKEVRQHEEEIEKREVEERERQKKEKEKNQEVINFILFCTPNEINRRMMVMYLWVPILILPIHQPSTTAASCPGLRSTPSPSFCLCTLMPEFK